MRKNLASVSIAVLLAWVVFFPDISPKQLVSQYKCDVSKVDNTWTVQMSKAYARTVAAQQYKWSYVEYLYLVKLWEAESHWNPKAYNYSVERDSGLHAGGIPQILGMSTKLPAPVQIDSGLAYIADRYHKPSIAWSHHKLHGWY